MIVFSVMLLFSDGVPIFKSSRTAMCPVYYNVLNLPPSVRTKSKNISLSGLYPESHHEHLLEPLISELHNLSTVGTMIMLSTGNVKLEAKLVLGIFDLPAKAAILPCI